MYYSITFGDGTLGENGLLTGKNTWEDWHLIPSSRPLVASPGVSTNMVQIPGRAGSLDLTEYLTGAPVFGDRSGSWEFYVENGHEYWVTIKDKIMSFLHGQRMMCTLEDDALYAYVGRFTLNEWRSESWNSSVVINYVLEPYKVYIRPELDWLWDPFNFEEDHTDNYPERKL